MYHWSNLGDFGKGPRVYADLDGYVPQEGDKPENFRWPHNEFTCDFDGGEGYEGYAQEQWENHLANAIAATEKAKCALREWQQAGLEED